MSQYDNLVHSKEAMIRLLYGVVALLAMLLLVALLGWSRAPDNIRLHYPPDLSRGAVQNLGDIPKVTIYTFAYYIFQQLLPNTLIRESRVWDIKRWRQR
mgnify:CR=1 FL=1